MAQIPRTGFIWHELMTTDTDAAEEFYREVTGLSATPGPYPTLMDGDQPTGGLVGPREEGPGWPSGGPEPHWIAYFGVQDVDAAVRTAQDLGGEILLAPVDIPEFGRAAVLRDPQGAAFGLYSPSR